MLPTILAIFDNKNNSLPSDMSLRENYNITIKTL